MPPRRTVERKPTLGSLHTGQTPNENKKNREKSDAKNVIAKRKKRMIFFFIIVFLETAAGKEKIIF